MFWSRSRISDKAVDYENTGICVGNERLILLIQTAFWKGMSINQGWTCDPYDEKIDRGALMNISEQERFDEMFPGFPLSMCRELVKFLNGEV